MTINWAQVRRKIYTCIGIACLVAFAHVFVFGCTSIESGKPNYAGQEDNTFKVKILSIPF